jgi:hypothetical protein
MSIVNRRESWCQADTTAYKGATGCKEGFMGPATTRGEKGVVVSSIRAVEERGYYWTYTRPNQERYSRGGIL